MNATVALKNFHNVQHIFSITAFLQLTANMYPRPISVHDGASYDYIIVGGGTAGCVIASRLVELKNVSVLLIEAGGNPPLESTYPGYFAAMKGTKVDWNFNSVAVPSVENQINNMVAIPQGKMLGGSSCLNYLGYVRGHERDYDRWANVTNDPSWSYKSIFKYFIKTENLVDKVVLASPEDKALHGTKGRMKLRKFYHENSEKYFKSFEEMSHKIIIDNNSRNPLGFTNLLYNIGDNVRQSTAHSFLRPVKDNSQLHVLTHALVIKICFEGKNAVWVEVLTKENKVITVKAKKEVILTAGVFKTAQLLMISGIGPKQHLENKGIKVLKNLPVGKNLMDHPIVLSVFKMGARQPLSWPLDPNIISFSSLDGYITFNKCKTVSDYMIRGLIIDNAQIFLQLCTIVFNLKTELCDILYKGTAGKQMHVAFSHLAYPKSRGEVLLNSSDIEDKPIIKLNLHSNKKDLHMHAKYIMDFNEVLNTTFFKEVGAQFVDPKLKNCGQFKLDSMEYWRCYVLSMVSTVHYNAGTYAMGTVVDSKLFVKGISGLRVADASVIPTTVSTPTLASVVMIAEKASDMIKKDFILN